MFFCDEIIYFACDIFLLVNSVLQKEVANRKSIFKAKNNVPFNV